MGEKKNMHLKVTLRLVISALVASVSIETPRADTNTSSTAAGVPHISTTSLATLTRTQTKYTPPHIFTAKSDNATKTKYTSEQSPYTSPSTNVSRNADATTGGETHTLFSLASVPPGSITTSATKENTSINLSREYIILICLASLALILFTIAQYIVCRSGNKNEYPCCTWRG